MDVGENCYLRTARKNWSCNAHGRGESPNCLGTIPKGTRYIEYVGESPLYQSGYRYCLPCARIQLPTSVDWARVDSECA